MATTKGPEPTMGPPTAEPTETRERSGKMVSDLFLWLIKDIIKPVIGKVAIPLIIYLVMTKIEGWNEFKNLLLNEGPIYFAQYFAKVKSYIVSDMSTCLILAVCVYLYYEIRKINATLSKNLSTNRAEGAFPVVTRSGAGEANVQEQSDEDMPELEAAEESVVEPSSGNRRPTRRVKHKSIDLDSLGKYKKICTEYGPTAPYCLEFLKAWSENELWTPQDFHSVAKSCLSSSHYLQWKMGLSDEAKKVIQSIHPTERNMSGVELTYEMLVGEGRWADPHKQATLPAGILTIVREIALWAWGQIDADSEFIGSYARIFQGESEPYADFLSKLSDTIQKQVRGTEMQEQLIRLFAFENANETCQAILLPIKGKNTMEYLRACRDVGVPRHPPHVRVTEAPSLRRPVRYNQEEYDNSYRAPNPRRRTPGLCPKCNRGYHWARDCRSYANPGSRNRVRGQPRDSRALVRCFNCGESGHTRRDCGAPRAPTPVNTPAHYPVSGNWERGQPQARQTQGNLPVSSSQLSLNREEEEEQ